MVSYFIFIMFSFPLHVFVACEESQEVCKAFRSLGHIAFSCDLLPCSGGHPEWHIIGDCLSFIDGHCQFTCSDGSFHSQPVSWDLVIAHPPCTFLSKCGAAFMYRPAGVLNVERFKKALLARDFFLRCLNCDSFFVAVENPQPLKVVNLPLPSDCIQPYQFGHPFSKKTFLWLKNLPPLFSTAVFCDYVPFVSSNCGGKKRGQKYSVGVARNARERSRTFSGIAAAMASQWSSYILSFDVSE